MNDLPPRLDTALRDLADRAPHDPALADTIRRRARLRRRAVLAPLAAVLAVLVVLGAIGVIRGGRAVSTGGGPVASVPVGTSATAAGSGCRPMSTAVLPEWARSGFSLPYTATFATSRSGHLLAVLFGPLTAPPAPTGPTNKVLWIPRTTPLPANPRQVVITAQLDGTDWTARVVLPDGFGPSTVDLPAPGCWHLQVIAGADIDELDLTYGGDPTATTATSGTS